MSSKDYELEPVKKAMFQKVIQARRENRELSHFAVSLEVYDFLRSKAVPQELWIEINPKGRMTLFGVNVIRYPEWSWGWMLFDKQRKPIE